MCNHGGMSLGVYPLGCPWRCITGRGGGGVGGCPQGCRSLMSPEGEPL